MRGVWACVATLALLMAASVSWIAAHPSGDEKDGKNPLPVCQLSMDTDEYQCELKNAGSYYYCLIEAPKKCRCAEGLVCKRSSVTNTAVAEADGSTQQQEGEEEPEKCISKCILADPKKQKKTNFDQNMEQKQNI